MFLFKHKKNCWSTRIRTWHLQVQRTHQTREPLGYKHAIVSLQRAWFLCQVREVRGGAPRTSLPWRTDMGCATNFPHLAQKQRALQTNNSTHIAQWFWGLV